jgi:sugar/nucleoside kinase (ribokinase family)
MNKPFPNISIDIKMDAGVAIEDACQQAVEFAEKLGVSIWFDFNGVKVLARETGDNPKNIVQSYHEVIKSSHSIKIASDRG